MGRPAWFVALISRLWGTTGLALGEGSSSIFPGHVFPFLWEAFSRVFRGLLRQSPPNHHQPPTAAIKNGAWLTTSINYQPRCFRVEVALVVDSVFTLMIELVERPKINSRKGDRDMERKVTQLWRQRVTARG